MGDDPRKNPYHKDPDFNVFDPVDSLRKFSSRIQRFIEQQATSRDTMWYYTKALHEASQKIDNATSYITMTRMITGAIKHEKVLEDLTRIEGMLELLKVQSGIIVAARATDGMRVFDEETYTLYHARKISSAEDIQAEHNYRVKHIIVDINSAVDELLEHNDGPLLLVGVIMYGLEILCHRDTAIPHKSVWNWFDELLSLSLLLDYVRTRKWKPEYSEIVRRFRPTLRMVSGRGAEHKIMRKAALQNTRRFLREVHRHETANMLVPKVLESTKLPWELVMLVVSAMCNFGTDDAETGAISWPSGWLNATP